MKLKPVLITLLCIIVVGAVAYGGYLYYQKKQEQNKPPQYETVTVEGKVTCLPHKDTEGPQTLECAAGIQNKDGKYYGLSTKDSTSELTSSMGDERTAKVTGELEPAGDSIYNIEGIIVVKNYEFIE